MTNLLVVLIGVSGGLAVGAAFVAFVILLDIIPRLIHLSETDDYQITYQNAYILGVIVFNFFYFSDFNLELNKVSVGILGLIMGTHTGLFSSALAEVLNIVPVLSKKFKVKDQIKILIYALLFGKVTGSLYYWLILR